MATETSTDVIVKKEYFGNLDKLIENISNMQENDEVNIYNKSLPIPADKVGSADSVDKNKLIIVDAAGEYKFLTIAELKTLLGI